MSTAHVARRARWHTAHARWHATHRRWRHSLQWRLVTVFMLLAAAMTGVFLLGMQRVLATGWQGYAKPIVADYLDRLTAEIGTPPDTARAQAVAARLPISVRIEGPRVRYDSHPERSEHRRWGGDDDHGPGAQDWGLVRSTPDGHRITFGLTSPLPGDRPRIFGWITLGVLLLITMLAFAYVRRLLRPLESINAGVARFGAGNFGTPITTRRRDELGELAEHINSMAGSLQGMLDAKRALLLSISHELRSPLTRARVNAELVPDGEHRDALLRDLGEMRDLISSLLESERLASGHAALQAQSTDLAALVREVAANAAADGQALTVDVDDGVGALSVDATRVRLLLRNLLANAQRHAAGATAPPTVYLRRETDSRVALGLRDHGPGVAPDILPRLAEAFYRPDAARTRSSGGVGLGLHLCRLVAQAHGGELRLRLAHPGLDVAMVWTATPS